MNKNFTNIFKEIDKENKFNLKIGLYSLLNQLTCFIAVCSIFGGLMTMIIGGLSLNEFWLIPIILSTAIISNIFDKKEKELRNKRCNQKIKIFEENFQMDNNFLKTFLQDMNESKVFREFLIILEKKERTIEEKEKIVDFIVNKEKNDIDSIKMQEENEKIENIKEKYNLIHFKEKEVTTKYNL
jgi:hypothetical protein